MAVDLKSHPGLNPDYFRLKAAREHVILTNKHRKFVGLPTQPVPPQPNKYIPHTGAKQLSKASRRSSPKPIPQNTIEKEEK